MKKILLSALLIAALNSAFAQQLRPVWAKDQANEWYSQRDWLRGADFIPSTAINQLEMWQAETFDTATIDRELGYAESIGLNCMRVFLHHVAWQQDPQGFKDRVNKYLSIANDHHIITMFVFFDDCWNPTYHAGKQPAPKPGIHNSGWIRDPGQLYYDEPKLVDTLERYVKDIMTTFKDDKRILLWDLYNEPGNTGHGSKSLPLLTKAFTWGRQVNPSQPLSAGIWNKDLQELNTYQLANSDVITYHDYNPVDVHQHTIDTLQKYGRPLLCTEYMARPRNSTFATVMPMLKKNFVAAINWGLVEGKTNTKYAWDTPMPNGDDPKVWFHEIFRKDGSPYNPEETTLIKALTSNP
ncbi:1,4-beta-xylanase [Ilyomonas limi]|uniref:1,4-beta-xylanase n=1 Tax=Ilyomonas limi TaxID=2575867 RepID=A0A4U3L5F6_9BACT|nr:cellulase family glycosylhydrolase [Ilyomonas limi]TKK70230.1 1,4-beta-xylanase [Ilyomonas limi]